MSPSGPLPACFALRSLTCWVRRLADLRAPPQIRETTAEATQCRCPLSRSRIPGAGQELRLSAASGPVP